MVKNCRGRSAESERSVVQSYRRRDVSEGETLEVGAHVTSSASRNASRKNRSLEPRTRGERAMLLELSGLFGWWVGSPVSSVRRLLLCIIVCHVCVRHAAAIPIPRTEPNSQRVVRGEFPRPCEVWRQDGQSEKKPAC